MRDSAAWQKVLVWFRRSKDVCATHDFRTPHLTRCIQNSRSPSAHVASDFCIEKVERDAPMERTTTNMTMSSRPQSTSCESYVTGMSTGRSSKATSRGWPTDVQSDTHSVASKGRKDSRRISLLSSHNPDEEFEGFSPTISPTTTRPLSYIPRNAASGHLRTTNPSHLNGKTRNGFKDSCAY